MSGSGVGNGPRPKITQSSFCDKPVSQCPASSPVPNRWPALPPGKHPAPMSEENPGVKRTPESPQRQACPTVHNRAHYSALHTLTLPGTPFKLPEAQSNALIPSGCSSIARRRCLRDTSIPSASAAFSRRAAMLIALPMAVNTILSLSLLLPLSWATLPGPEPLRTPSSGRTTRQALQVKRPGNRR